MQSQLKQSIPVDVQSRRDLVVWLVLSDKTGDNAQLLQLAETLPWPCQAKHIAVRDAFVLGKPRVAASLHHIDPKSSDALEPPWPDLVITIGRRMSMVALWIKQQAGGRTRIALIGAPKGDSDKFDLVVVSEQYRLADRANVMRIRYPLQRIDETAIAAESEAWRGQLEQMSRPVIAVMVGGRTKAVRFDAAVATQLARDVAGLARREGGTLFVTTSRRTPSAVVDALERELPPDAVLYRWTAGDERNPYRALLGLADRFVVTSDSLSMLMEIARLGRPLAIYPLPLSSWFFSDGLRIIGEFFPLVGHRRDLAAIPRQLVKDRHAIWFGEAFRLDVRRPPDEVGQVAARIVALMEPQRVEAQPSMPAAVAGQKRYTGSPLTERKEGGRSL